MPLNIKSLPETMLTQIYVIIYSNYDKIESSQNMIF